jgi:hypothetical protein
VSTELGVYTSESSVANAAELIRLNGALRNSGVLPVCFFAKSGPPGRLYVLDSAGFDAYAAWYLADTRGTDVAVSDLNEWKTGNLPNGAKPWEWLGAYTLAELRRGPLTTPLDGRPRSLFLAACRRRRDFGKDHKQEFVRKLASLFEDHEACHPFHDTILLSDFESERQLLRRDRLAYARDVRRARRFAAFLSPRGTPAQVPARKVFEGIWVEDPESLLLADWAWRDTVHSRDHNGFAVVISELADLILIAADPRLDLDLHALFERLGADAPNGSWIETAALKLDGNSDESLQIADSVHGWWTLRGCRRNCPTGYDLEKRLRECLEATLFKDKVECFEIRESDRTELRPCCEPTGSPLEFWDLHLSKELPPKLPPTAVDTVGRVLWTLARQDDDKREGVSETFERDHLQGDSGVITVWSRRGIACASWTGEGEETAAGLKTKLAVLGNLMSEATTPEERKKSFIEYSNLQRDLAKPDPACRLLRRLFERLDFAEIHRARVDLDLSEERRDLAAQTKAIQEEIKISNDERAQLAKHANEIQRKLEYFEILIVTFYSFEFSHQLLDKPIERLAAGWSGPWGGFLHLLLPLLVTAFVYPAYRVTKGFLLEHLPDAPSDTDKESRRRELDAGQRGEEDNWANRKLFRPAVWGIGVFLLISAAILVYVASQERARESAPPSDPAVSRTEFLKESNRNQVWQGTMDQRLATIEKRLEPRPEPRLSPAPVKKGGRSK